MATTQSILKIRFWAFLGLTILKLFTSSVIHFHQLELIYEIGLSIRQSIEYNFYPIYN